MPFALKNVIPVDRTHRSAFVQLSVLGQPHSFSRARDRCGHWKLQALSTACPWRTLGVSEDADEKTIRRAYRKLALRHHPDVDGSPEAPEIFVAVHEAYEMLIGRKRGKESGSQRQKGGWDFHDWYWSFKTTRRQATRAPGSKQQQHGGWPLTTARLQDQLLGLKRRAAARRSQRGAHAVHSREEANPGSEEQAACRATECKDSALCEPGGAAACAEEETDATDSEPTSSRHTDPAPQSEAVRTTEDIVCKEGMRGVQRLPEFFSNAVVMRTQLSFGQRKWSGGCDRSAGGSTSPGCTAVLEAAQVAEPQSEPQSQRWSSRPATAGQEPPSSQENEVGGEGGESPFLSGPLSGQLAGLRRRAHLRRTAGEEQL